MNNLCDKIKQKPNLIEHMSEHDGTRRSLQACHIIEKHNPQNADDLAKIIFNNNEDGNEVIWNLPFFYDDEELVSYCNKHYKNRNKNDWAIKRCITHADDVDLTADIWKLSPDINDKYPSVEKYFMGTDIGAGWHNFHRDVVSKLGKMYKD